MINEHTHTAKSFRFEYSITYYYYLWILNTYTFKTLRLLVAMFETLPQPKFAKFTLSNGHLPVLMLGIFFTSAINAYYKFASPSQHSRLCKAKIVACQL